VLASSPAAARGPLAGRSSLRTSSGQAAVGAWPQTPCERLVDARTGLLERPLQCRTGNRASGAQGGAGSDPGIGPGLVVVWVLE
jgi:hypothetical protein